MAQVEVKSSDVIKLILQFLKQNNLYESFQVLQKQSKITLNTVDTLHFINSIMESKWDLVLQILNTLMINQEHLFNLYELILDDLIQNDRYQAAQFVIKNVVKKNIKNVNSFRQRIMRVEYIIENPHEKAIYKKTVTQHRKKDIIQQCLFDINQDVQPNRLLKLLTQSIKFQYKEGIISPNIKLNLFQGKQKIVTQEQQTIIKSIEKVVRYPQDAKINAVALSSGQQYLALGGLDGLIQIYNTLDYTLHTGIKFQAQNIFLSHDHPVTLMQFNNNDQMLASVDSKGIINIWNLQNGKLLRKIQGEGGVSSICWGIDPSHILAGYQDIHLYGIRSKLILKQYSMSATNQFLNKVLASENKIYGITNSGLIKIFSYASQEQLISTNLRQIILNVIPIYQSRGSKILDRVIISCVKKIYELNRNGEQQSKYEIQNGQLINTACVGEFLYQFIKAEDKLIKLNVFSRSSHKNVYYSRIDNEVIFCLMQRNKNLMITYDDKDNLNFWRPSY